MLPEPQTSNIYTPCVPRQATGLAMPDLHADEVVRVALPGTCGELVQGSLEGEPCLISCPMGWYSIAAVRFQSCGGWTVPTQALKTRAALHTGLAYLGRTASGGCVHLHTELPRGRGYGSSTADIGATLYALGHAAGRRLTPQEVARLAVQVEPSDSTLFPGLALWDHRSGHVYEDLGAPPPSRSWSWTLGVRWIRWPSTSSIIVRPYATWHPSTVKLLACSVRAYATATWKRLARQRP